MADKRGQPIMLAIMLENRVCLLVVAGCLSGLGCGRELIRPRSAAEDFKDRPEFALVVGQFEMQMRDVPEEEVGLTPHRVMAGSDTEYTRDLIPSDGRTFAVWMVPGVLCFARPSFGQPPKMLGKGAPCAEVPEAGKAYYVGSVVWTIKKNKQGAVVGILQVKDQRESVTSSSLLQGVYPEPVLASDELDGDKAAVKYSKKE